MRKEGLQKILGFLRAMQWNLLTSHWQTKGVPYYGDHLLFMRLYENMDDQIDALAEKIVGYFDPATVGAMTQMKLLYVFLAPFLEEEDLFKRALEMEIRLQAILEEVYQEMKEDGMPMGIDDFLMGLASEHETHIYLLKQRLRDHDH